MAATTTGSNPPTAAGANAAASAPYQRKVHVVSPSLDFSASMDALSHEVDTYFTGPIDTTKHSKLPHFMRIQGSVLPGMIIPMLFVGGWTTAIVVISNQVHSLAISNQLITVLGFLVGLALSFRSTTAYERYNEGRKYWAQLTLNSRNLARIFWIHGKEREDSEAEDVLAKVTAINLILAFAVATKHKLRLEPEYDYKDLQQLITNLTTYTKEANEGGGVPAAKPMSRFKRIMCYLGVPFFESNPAKRLKAYHGHGKHYGNLPLEVMSYLSTYVNMSQGDATLAVPAYQAAAITYLAGMMDSLGGCERILQTPLPIAYSIVISQVTWLYVLALPFQLYGTLEWVAIPATLIAAYIILGLAAIGREIENPFGHDVNDLDLDRYCDSLSIELDLIMSRTVPTKADFITRDDNYVMFPNIREGGYEAWKARGPASIRAELKEKPYRHLPPVLAKRVRTMQLEERAEEKAEAEERRSIQAHRESVQAQQDQGGAEIERNPSHDIHGHGDDAV